MYEKEIANDILIEVRPIKLRRKILMKLILFMERIEKEARKETAQDILRYLKESGVINTAPQTIKMYFRETYGVEE